MRRRLALRKRFRHDAGTQCVRMLAIAAIAGVARAQVVETFSIDYHGPTIAVPDSMFGVPITEGDLLRALPASAVGPLPPPALWISGGFPGPAFQGLGLALHPPAIGHPPGVPGFVEVDAVSLGLDPQLTADALLLPGRLRFSVDEFAAGTPSPASWPSVFTEAAPGVDEAAADVFTNLSAITLPGPPPPPLFGLHAAALDGDGLPSASGYAYPGHGLREPTLPVPPPNPGDNLDALTTLGDPNAVYFSLDAGFPDPHPLAGGLPGSGSPFPGIYVPAEALGLGTFRSGTAWPGPPALGFADDLDALNLLSSALAAPHPSLVAAGYCYCGVGAPCANPFPTGGCVNNTGTGAVLAASGSSSVTLDDLVLSATGLPAGQFGIFYMGGLQSALPFGNGLRCVLGAPGVGVFRYAVQSTGAGGTMTLGPGIVALAAASFPPAGSIAAGSLWNLQAWYRDPSGPCGASFNFSNAQAVQFVP